VVPLLFSVIVGEVLFNASYPSEPPDFIFSENSHQFQPDVADLRVINAARLLIDHLSQFIK